MEEEKIEMKEKRESTSFPIAGKPATATSSQSSPNLATCVALHLFHRSWPPRSRSGHPQQQQPHLHPSI